ncbi:DUF4282 domain-containing protein [Aquamicrobium lusatiense]|uniref:Zn-dependent protease with chaperone function n=1 Tax=Aquamicrobium lusatiense TaxID=89772 RepID=A0A7W9S0M0_9HYPH|nr:DUF4282 domain-containing protein [Aquamicrobium lusatiense]MBB6011710.1 Zn-dependent protease with chaperone function [Aquamicrobium lusatiense]MDH4992195.1 DUF4282 domain-containing protein [Aquamicrobium lusatiense]
MQLSDLFGFEKLVTTAVIKIAYWIGIVVCVLGGIGGFLAALFNGMPLQGILYLVIAIFSLLMWRVACEIYIVIFGMYDRLGQIRDSLARRSGDPQQRI